MPDGYVTFHRQVLKDSDVPKWSGSETCLTELYISSKGNIEDEQSLLQVVFATLYPPQVQWFTCLLDSVILSSHSCEISDSYENFAALNLAVP